MDDHTITETRPPERFEDRLLAELRDVVRLGDSRQAAVPSNRTSPRRAGVLAAAALLAVLAVLTPAIIDGDLGSPAFAVRALPDGQVQVTVQEHFDDPGRLEEQLLAHGIAVEVTEVPGSPGMVGRLGHVFLPEGAEGLEVNRESPGHVWDFVIDPERFTGTVTLEVVRAPAGGEPLVAVGDVFAPGEPLEALPCVAGWPVDAAALDDAAARAGLAVRWLVVGDVDDSGWSATETSSRPDGVVFSAHLADGGTLQVAVVAADRPRSGGHWDAWLQAGEEHTADCPAE